MGVKTALTFFLRQCKSWNHISFQEISGPICSKLLMLLLNQILNFSKSIVLQNTAFLQKNPCKACHKFFSKYICILDFMILADLTNKIFIEYLHHTNICFEQLGPWCKVSQELCYFSISKDLAITSFEIYVYTMCFCQFLKCNNFYVFLFLPLAIATFHLISVNS